MIIAERIEGFVYQRDNLSADGFVGSDYRFLLSSFLDWEEAFPLFGDLSFLFDSDCGVRSLYFVLIKYIKEEAGNDYGAMGGAQS